MKVSIAVLIVGLFVTLLAFGSVEKPQQEPRLVLVELFTSEGCSSCPPAEALANELHRTQPIDGVEVVTIAWHVTYWDDLGWIDPLGDDRFTQRQRDYARAFARGNVYTPQMVVGGATEFVGSNGTKARSAIPSADAVDVIAVEIASFNDGMLRGTVAGVDGPITLVVVEDGLTSQIKRGENRGKTLTHDGVARTLDTAAAGAFVIEVPANVDPANARLVAFAQSEALGPVTAVGVASLE